MDEKTEIHVPVEVVPVAIPVPATTVVEVPNDVPTKTTIETHPPK